LHLTLRFIGESDCQGFAALREALGDLQGEAFQLQPQGLGVFPTPMRPRILWLGFRSEGRLLDLQKSIEKSLQRLGLPPENKPFSPHLTLGRCKFPAPREVGAFLARHRDFQAESFEVREFRLYSSTPSPRSSIYRIEQSYPLV
ncbi:MAG TPA: RNA 2',3'-cyclic phosphodiesterase, partial [bacterium]|nr:RNA 2',3'-cyclic phosphodiesterase [bacterium]